MRFIITALDSGAVPDISTNIMGMTKIRQALKELVLLRKIPLKRIKNANGNVIANDDSFVSSKLAVAAA